MTRSNTLSSCLAGRCALRMLPAAGLRAVRRGPAAPAAAHRETGHEPVFRSARPASERPRALPCAPQAAPGTGVFPIQAARPARVPSAALAQQHAEDVALLVGERAEAGRRALAPLPVLGRQVILAVAAAPGCRLAPGGVRRQLLLARAGVLDCPEPLPHAF